MSHPAGRPRLILAAKVGLAVGLSAWLLTSGRLRLGRLASLPLDGRLAALLALVAGSMALPAVRWWWLLRIQGLRESPRKVVSLTWAGYFAALILPGAASGDLARGYLILRHRSQARARAFSTVLVDRFLGLHGLFCLGSLSAAWLIASGGAGSAAVRTMAALTVTPLAAMTAALIALLCAPTRRLLFRILPATWRDAWDESFALYHADLPGLAGCFVLSMASGAMTVGSFSLAGRLLGDATMLSDSCLVGPLIVVANCLPITPGGIGLAEAVSSQLFSGLGSSGGAEIMILLRACGFILSLPGALAVGAILPGAREGGAAPAAVPAQRPGQDDADDLAAVATSDWGGR